MILACNKSLGQITFQNLTAAQWPPQNLLVGTIWCVLPNKTYPQVKFGVPSSQIKLCHFCRFSALLAVRSALGKKAITEYHHICLAVFNLLLFLPVASRRPNMGVSGWCLRVSCIVWMVCEHV